MIRKKFKKAKSSGSQTGGHRRANRSNNFSIKVKNEKLNSSLSKQVNNSPYFADKEDQGHAQKDNAAQSSRPWRLALPGC